MPVAPPLVSVEEYLHTVYKPDRDYVDGELSERNMADVDHGQVQALTTAYFVNRRREWGITVLTETRVQVKPTRFRIPDICIVLDAPDEQILTKPPFLCIEILSPEDRWSRVRERIDDFLAMGVPFVWVLDPATWKAYTMTSAEGLREVTRGICKPRIPNFISLRSTFSNRSVPMAGNPSPGPAMRFTRRIVEIHTTFSTISRFHRGGPPIGHAYDMAGYDDTGEDRGASFFRAVNLCIIRWISNIGFAFSCSSQLFLLREDMIQRIA